MTLIETLVVGGLFASISLMTTLWLSGVADLWWTSSTQAHARTTVQQAVSRMGKELRMTTRTSGGVIPLFIPLAPDNTQAAFYLPTDWDGNGLIVNAQGGIEWDMVETEYVYDAATRHVLRVYGGAQQIIANDVVSAQFDDQSIDPALADDEVRIRLSMELATPNGRQLQASASEIVRLRN
jgi:hypothetical protein